MTARRKHLAQRLNRIFGAHSRPITIERFRAIVGAKNPLSTTAAEAREKLQDGAKLQKFEYDALELMIRVTRPALLVRQGVPVPIPAGNSAGLFPEWNTFR